MAAAAERAAETRTASTALSSDAEEEMYSKRVADMVLAGWTLLDEFCPVYTAVPLVMDAKGRRYSVAQEAYVEERDARSIREFSGEAHANDSGSKRFTEARDPVHGDSLSLREVRPEQGLQRNRDHPSLAMPLPSASAPLGKDYELSPSAGLDEALDPYEIIRATQRTLFAKIQVAEQALQEGSTQSDAATSSLAEARRARPTQEQQQQLVALIRECSEALLALREVSGDTS
eukprot:INCI13182.1.p1 GENE.INCI13182.1~~INCI13182.1.p1  ORF type:complete len:232 (-),score=48.08 INCI13182.1:61-756(-)